MSQIWVNTYHRYDDCAPFGGYKQSGIGREKGAEALDNYLQVTSFSHFVCGSGLLLNALGCVCVQLKTVFVNLE